MATALNIIGDVRPAFTGRAGQRQPATVLPISRDWRTIVRAARSPLAPGDLPRMSLRRFVANVCTAEVKHAHADFWRRVHAIGAAAVIDRREEPDIDVAFRLAHEALAGVALVWLSHLQAHDSDRFGPWACWDIKSPAEKWAWREKRRTIREGLIKAADAYRAARASIDGGSRGAACARLLWSATYVHSIEVKS
jgi:hypothetical protein